MEGLTNEQLDELESYCWVAKSLTYTERKLREYERGEV